LKRLEEGGKRGGREVRKGGGERVWKEGVVCFVLWV
jgi:hypothetical protein